MNLAIIAVLYFVQLSASNSLYTHYPPGNYVAFYLFDRSNIDAGYQLFTGNNTLLLDSKFDPNIPTKIIIHGWTHGKDTPWVKELREVLIDAGFWNVLVVDWSSISHLIYLESRLYTASMAEQIAKFISFISSLMDYPLDRIHIVAHSMGAQIAAAVGCDVQEMKKEKIGRITGLDPAAPLFEWPRIEPLEKLLDPTDAHFVDVIHTNGKRIGMISPAGHVDYYPNGGVQQWGCYLWSCSHNRVCDFFIASVRKPDLFRAYSHDSVLRYANGTSNYLEVYPMGIAANPDIPKGIYFLRIFDEYKNYTSSSTSLIDSIDKLDEEF